MSNAPEIDLNEYGGKKDGERTSMNRRLFMQLVVVDTPDDSDPAAVAQDLVDVLVRRQIAAVVYADASHPRGLGLLSWSDSPAHFVQAVRPLFAETPLRGLRVRPGFTMLGRTYALGYEPDLEHAIIRRPIERVTADGFPWHVWYPLRRKGTFNRLAADEQSPILREHAAIGMAYGQTDLAHDVRLACHGIDTDDNDFVIGLIGRELHPLSHLVQTMRRTRQTAEFIEKMGPFFIGFVVGRST